MFFAGRRALITGASRGLGAAFAQALAKQGSHLTLVARSQPQLEALATELRACHAVQVHIIVQDLTLPGAVARVQQEAMQGGQAIDILVNNAGFGCFGRFEALDIVQQLQEIMLNVAALTELTHAFLPGMQKRRYGNILQVASTAAFAPVPYMATYAATKAYVLSLSEALWAENKDRGVAVLAVCPGPTDTDFFTTLGSELPPALGNKQAPADVVAQALTALQQRRSTIVCGARNRLVTQSPRLLPRQTVATMAERLMRGGLLH